VYTLPLILYLLPYTFLVMIEGTPTVRHLTHTSLFHHKW